MEKTIKEKKAEYRVKHPVLFTIFEYTERFLSFADTSRKLKIILFVFCGVIAIVALYLESYKVLYAMLLGACYIAIEPFIKKF